MTLIFSGLHPSRQKNISHHLVHCQHPPIMASTQCELYMYTPSLALAIIGVILFSALTTIHLYRMIESKAWFGIFFVLGGLGKLSLSLMPYQSVNNM